MEEQRISVQTRRVEIALTNGERLKGELFLQLHGAHIDGPQRLGEILNGEDSYIPLRHDGQIDLINLEQVVAVSSSATEEVDDLLKIGEEHQVKVYTTTGQSMDLRIYVNLPCGKTRVKDFLNQRKKFLLFLHDDTVIYLSRDNIIRVLD